MLTLGTQRDLTNDMLIKGIIDSVVTVNQFYNMLPFKGIQGNALAYNREVAGIDQTTLVSLINTDEANTISKAQQTFSRHSTELTTIIGDAQVNGLIQAVGSDYNDATAVQVAAKAKGIGRVYMNSLINGELATPATVAVGLVLTNPSDLRDRINTAAGTAVSNADVKATGTAAVTFVVSGIPFVGPLLLSTNALTVSGAALDNLLLRVASIAGTGSRTDTTNGPSAFDGLENFVLSSNNVLYPEVQTARRLNYLDEIIDRVHDKDGMVDYLMMNSAGVRKITEAFRTVGTGFDMMDVKTSSGGVMQVQSYRGVPIFRNDFIGTGSRAGLGGGDGNDSSIVYAGTVDDGSFSHGICGLTALKSAGMQVQKLGARENVDADITRVKWYCGLAHFSELGLVRGHMA